MEPQHNQYITAALVVAAIGACVYLAAIHSITGDLAVTVILSALGITGTVRGAQVGGQLALQSPPGQQPAATVDMGTPQTSPPAPPAPPPVGTV